MALVDTQTFYQVSKDRREKARAKTPVPDLDKLPPTATLTTRQVSLVSGFSEYTFRLWRMQKKGKGPRVTIIDGSARYFVRDVCSWMNLPTDSNTGAA